MGRRCRKYASSGMTMSSTKQSQHQYPISCLPDGLRVERGEVARGLEDSNLSRRDRLRKAWYRKSSSSKTARGVEQAKWEWEDKWEDGLVGEASTCGASCGEPYDNYCARALCGTGCMVCMMCVCSTVRMVWGTVWMVCGMVCSAGHGLAASHDDTHRSRWRPS